MLEVATLAEVPCKTDGYVNRRIGQVLTLNCQWKVEKIVPNQNGEIRIMRTVKATIWLREDIYEQVEAMDGVYDMDWLDVNDDE